MACFDEQLSSLYNVVNLHSLYNVVNLECSNIKIKWLR